MDFYERFAGAWRMPQWLNVGEDFQDGFFAAFALLVALFLVLLLIRRLTSTARSAAGINIPGPMGDLFITTNAVREFVAHILEDFSDFKLKCLKLRVSGRRVTIILEVGVASDSGLPSLRDALQSRLVAETGEKLGLEQAPQIHLKIRSLKVDGPPASIESEPESLTDDDLLEP